MEKLIVICGPTATGKTSLAIKLAGLFDGEIISADSRQVYRRLDIGTGKDKPKDTKIWGYDLIEPDKEFSVAHYQEYAKKTIKGIYERNNLPILVGGTGLYIQAVVDGIDTANIPQDKHLRASLINKSARELFDLLEQIDELHARSLNNSDRNNPRRLVRAIEIAQFGKKTKTKIRKTHQALFIGLTALLEMLFKNIESRVHKRIDQGFEEEVKALLNSGINWDMQSMQSLGYRQWHAYLVGKVSQEDAIKDWIHQEALYAKRQLTWFKRDKRINWFDVSNSNWQEKVLKLVNSYATQS